jgi:DNA-binding protein
MLQISGPPKQLARNLRDSLEQLDDHRALLEAEGRAVKEAICVVNLTKNNLLTVRRSGFPLGLDTTRLASISTRSNSVNTIGVCDDPVTTQANWMISFLSPNQGIGVG